MYQRILVPLDGSALAEQVLQHVEALAEKFGSSIVVLRTTELLATGAVGAVATAPAQDPTLLLRAEQQTAVTYLEEVAERLRSKGFTVELRQPEGSATEQILYHARDSGADLIAMATHGRGGVTRVLLGSVADEVVRNAFCPVLLIRVSGHE